MKFCDAAACPSCPLRTNVPACLRHKAQFCIRLATEPSARGIYAVLDKMSLQLMEEAAAPEKETAVLLAASHQVT
jgi:hypothetical protein